MSNAIHIHEDDWGLCCIYPMAAYKNVDRDLRRSVGAGEENLNPSGFGWTDLYLIQEPGENYLPARLALSKIESSFSSIMPRASHFSATSFSYIGRKGDPWGSYTDNPWCFGLDSHCYVYLNEEDSFLKSICFECDGSPQREDRMRKAFATIDAFEPSVLVDYREDVCGPLSDMKFVEKYFELKSETLKRIEGVLDR